MTEVAIEILEELAQRYGSNKTAILELIIREKATMEGIRWIKTEETQRKAEDESDE